MKTLAQTLLLLLFTVSTLAQSLEPDCNAMLQKGDELFAEPEPALEKVLKSYLNALNCNSKLSGIVGPKIQRVFELIEEQKKNELAARKRAQRNEKEANKQRAIAEEQRSIAEAEQAKAEAAAKQAQRNSKANSNAIEALKLNTQKNPLYYPSLAIRLAELNYHLYPESKSAFGVLNEIFTASEPVHKTLMRSGGSSFIYSPKKDKIFIPSYDKAFWINLNGDTTHAHTFDDSFFAAAAAPDANKVVTTNHDSVSIWDANWKKLSTMVDTTFSENLYAFQDFNSIPSIEFSPTGAHFITNNGFGVTLWTAEGEIVKSFPYPYLMQYPYTLVKQVGFSPTGDKFFIFRSDVISTFDLEGELVSTFKREGAYSVAFAPKGDQMILADYCLGFFDLQGNVLGWSNECHDFPIEHIAFSPDGKYILTGSRDNQAYLWDSKGYKLKTLFGHKNWVTLVGFTADGSFAMTASKDGSIKKWPLQGADKKLIKAKFGNEDIKGKLFLKNGKSLLLSAGKQTYLWDLRERKTKKLDNSGVFSRSSAETPNGDLLLTAEKKDLMLWDEEGNAVDTVPSPFTPSAIGLLADGNSMILAGKTNDGNGVYRLNREGEITDTFDVSKQDYTKRIEVSPNGKYFVALPTNVVSLWDVEDHKIHMNSEEIREYYISATFSADNKYFLLGGNNGKLVLGDVEKRTLKVLKIFQYQIDDVSFSADGKSILVTSGGTIFVLTSEGKILDKIPGNYYFAFFSPDDASVFYADEDEYEYGGIKLFEKPILANFLRNNVDNFDLPFYRKAGLRYSTEDMERLEKNGPQW